MFNLEKNVQWHEKTHISLYEEIKKLQEIFQNNSVLKFT